MWPPAIYSIPEHTDAGVSVYSANIIQGNRVGKTAAVAGIEAISPQRFAAVG